MINRWVIADLHFYHENIIKYENRPFGSTGHMNHVLVNNWNKIVKKRDKIFVLGDFSLSNKEKTENIINKLNGHKILIMGNHDKQRSVSWWYDAGFDRVIEYPIIVDEFYILSHEPLYVNENMPYINIHGHIHGKSIAGNKHICVSVEQIEYNPINLNTIIEKEGN